MLHIKTTDFVQGRGYWKFNNSLLSDKEYIQTIKTLIIDIERQYAALVYNINEIQNIKDSEIVFQISDSLFFDTLLMEIRGKSISFSTYKKRKLKEEEKKLEDEIKNLEIFLDESNKQILADKQIEFENLRAHKLKGNYIRSRAQWIEEGEKPTRYFCNLESRNFINKQ